MSGVVAPGVVEAVTRLAASAAEAQARRAALSPSPVSVVKPRAKRSYRPSARSDVLDLVNALGRAEWGPIRGHKWRAHRVILSTLAALMYDAHRGMSADFITTAYQIADRAGYSYKWARTVLNEMEDMGLIVWMRGGIEEAHPTPSRIRIVKRMLADWIGLARERHEVSKAKRLAEFVERLSHIRHRRLPPSKRLKHKAYKARKEQLEKEERWLTENASILEAHRLHEEPTTSPLTDVREVAAKPASRSAHNQSIPPQEDTDMLAYEPYMNTLCNHGTNPHADPTRCNRCRYEAIQRLQDAKAQEAAEQARLAETPTPYEAYMRATYPDVHPLKWYTIAKTDPRAKELLHATA